MVSSDHQHHLDETVEIIRKPSSEPEQPQTPANTKLLFEDFREFHSSVNQLLPPLIGDRRHERGWFPDESQLAGPHIVHRHLWGCRLRLLNDNAFLHKLKVCPSDSSAHVVEAVGNNSPGLLERGVLSRRCLFLALCACSCVTKLDLVTEGTSTGSAAQGDQRLRDTAVLESLADFVFLYASNLSEQNQHLDLRVLLVPQEMVHERCPWKSVPADGDPFVDAVGVLGNDIVQLVGEASGPRHVSYAPRPVELRGDDVIQGTAGISNAEASGLDTANCGRSDDRDAFLPGGPGQHLCAALRDAFGNDGVGLNPV
mmetsp:Transcript_29805/g.72664  ORF Transcript_29805/g.72664 Transcript_29805/m.72664 type:complete len:313 (+) Transcript_29805:867-1805(+)